MTKILYRQAGPVIIHNSHSYTEIRAQSPCLIENVENNLIIKNVLRTCLIENDFEHENCTKMAAYLA